MIFTNVCLLLIFYSVKISSQSNETSITYDNYVQKMLSDQFHINNENFVQSIINNTLNFTNKIVIDLNNLTYFRPQPIMVNREMTSSETTTMNMMNVNGNSTSMIHSSTNITENLITPATQENISTSTSASTIITNITTAEAVMSSALNKAVIEQWLTLGMSLLIYFLL